MGATRPGICGGYAQDITRIFGLPQGGINRWRR